MSTKHTRRPAVAGQFYPKDPAKLRAAVEGYLSGTGIDAAPEHVTALVAPHAGYVYSGPAAGHAYARARGKRPERVIVMGCSHRYFIDTASVYAQGAFETPLGTLEVDEPFAKELASRLESRDTEPHTMEHSLEVQLPFIQVAIGDVPIVPVLFGGNPHEWHARAGETLSGMVSAADLVIASTDLSHYLSEEEANEMDQRTIAGVLSQDWKDLAARIASRTCSMCGAAAVAAAMTCALAREATRWQLCDYRTSARASGDYDRVVGYAAISMERSS